MVRKEDMYLTSSEEAAEVLAGLTAMGIVVSWDDACRNFDRLELLLACPNDRQVGALEKVFAPVRHDGDKTLGAHFHQRIAVLRSRFDAFFPVFHVTDLGHASLLGRFNELAVIFLRQPLTRKASTGDAPKQQTSHRLRMTQSKQESRSAAGGTPTDKSGERTELSEQLVNIIGPDLVFRVLPIDDDIRSATVAPVKDHDTVALFGHPAGQQLDAADVSPAAGRERHPRTVVAEYLIVHANIAHFC